MKIATIRSKEFLMLENIAFKNTAISRNYLKNMHENFVVPYVDYLNKFSRRINEADLSADQVNQLFQSIAQDIQAGGSNETTIGKMLPDSIKKKFADSLPAADAGEVQGFDQQANTMISQVQDPATKKGLMALVKQGIQSPATQKMIIAAVQGIAGVAAGALTGGLGGALGAGAAGAISGGLIGIVTAKMQGQDWKSAGKAGLQGAAVGAIGGLAGNMAAAGASAALDATASSAAPGTTAQQSLDIPAELKAGSAAADLKAAQEYAVADQAEKAEIRNVTGLSDKQLTDLANQPQPTPAQATDNQPVSTDANTAKNQAMLAGQKAVQDAIASGVDPRATNTLAGYAREAMDKYSTLEGGPISVQSTEMLSKQVALQAVDQANVNAGNASATSAAPETRSTPTSSVPLDQYIGKTTEFGSTINNVASDGSWVEETSPTGRVSKMMFPATISGTNVANASEYLSARGLFSESVSRTRSSATLVDRDLTVRMWALNESLGKRKGGVQLTEAGVKDVVSGVKNWLKTKGQNITQKVTPDKLMQAWTTAGKPTDSEKVYQFLQNQEIPVEIIDRIFTTLKIPTAGDAATQAPVTGSSAFGSMANQLGQPATGTATPPATGTATPPATGTATPPATGTATPAPSPVVGTATPPATGTVFDHPDKLLADFTEYVNAGGNVTSQFRDALKDALLKGFLVVESKNRKFVSIVQESNRISSELKKLKKSSSRSKSQL